MTTKLFITIDVEEDSWGDYGTSSAPVASVSQLPSLQSLFSRYGAVPTYLVTWPVVKNEAAANTLRKLRDVGEHEIGTHCHPWTTPPFEEERNARNSWLCNLPADLVWKKLQNLHGFIVDRLGVVPSSFRAGRWGFGGDVATCIQRLGYTVDTSVSPTIDWTAGEGPDFTAAMGTAYRFDPADVLLPKPVGGLMEVPATIGFLQGNHRTRLAIRRHLSGRLAKPFRILGVLDWMGVLNHRWLSPEPCGTIDMIGLAKSFAEAGCDSVNMFFHSNSLIPGVNPFVRTGADLARFLERIRAFIEFAALSGFEFAPLSKAVQTRAPT